MSICHCSPGQAWTAVCTPMGKDLAFIIDQKVGPLGLIYTEPCGEPVSQQLPRASSILSIPGFSSGPFQLPIGVVCSPAA